MVYVFEPLFLFCLCGAFVQLAACFFPLIFCYQVHCGVFHFVVCVELMRTDATYCVCVFMRNAE